MSRILIIEDNLDLAYGLCSNLELEGYDVETTARGDEGLDSVARRPPDLIVLDLMMPGMDGYATLAKLRADGFAGPVLILTARSEEVDKVRGLRGGADDYMTKPFGLLELIARVEALLRRAPAAGRGDCHRIDGIEVRMGSRQVFRDGVEVSLTPKEFGLLLALIERGGEVASRIELMGEVWGHRSAVISRTVDTHIGELRRKLEKDPGNPRHILTVHKVGYRLI